MRVNLQKYGFMRMENEDFSDDGTRFYVYRKPGSRVRVTKATGCGMYFILAARKNNFL